MIGFSALKGIFGDSILGSFLRKTQFFQQKHVVWGKVNKPLCSADHQLSNDTLIVKIGFN
jgi:hypothetical protein